jgi:hypothetical protein
VFAIRCTEKLLERGPLPVAMSLPPSTTILGDWYANILITRPQHLVLCVSEKTLLPVVVTAKDPRALPVRLTQAVEAMLAAIGVPQQLVRAEVREMSESCFAKTESRKLLGSLNDFMFHLRDGCASDTSLSLDLISEEAQPVSHALRHRAHNLAASDHRSSPHGHQPHPVPARHVAS